MSGIQMALLGSVSSTLDIQTVTTGGSGTAPNRDRLRGFSGGLGSIVDGTSNIYSGAAITTLYWDENGGTSRFYQLTITGAANSGWTTLIIGSQSFLRTSATYLSGTWYWSTSDILGTQSFGSIGSTVVCTFT